MSRNTLARWIGPILGLSFVVGAAPLARGQAESYSLGESGRWEAQEQERDADERTIDAARRLLAEDKPGRARAELTTWLDDTDHAGSIWRPTALRLRGDAKVAESNEYQALYDYEEVIRAFPQSDEFLVAVERELQIALKYAGGLKRRVWGMRLFDATDIAVELLIRVQERTPGSDLAERAAIELADFYYRTGEIALASEAYDLYTENFPAGPNLLKARQRRIYADIARFKGPKYDASGLIDAQIQIRELRRDAPVQAEQAGLSAGMETRIEESLAAQMLDTADWYLRRGEWPSARLLYRRIEREHPSTVAAARARDALREHGWADTTEPATAGSTDTAGEPSAEPESAGRPSTGDTP